MNTNKQAKNKPIDQTINQAHRRTSSINLAIKQPNSQTTKQANNQATNQQANQYIIQNNNQTPHRSSIQAT